MKGQNLLIRKEILVIPDGKDLFRRIYRIIVILSMLMISVIGFLIITHGGKRGDFRMVTVGLMLLVSGIFLAIEMIRDTRY